MSLLHLAYIIALRRIISGWRLELVLFLGMVLAVALMSSGVIFSDLVAESALSRALDQATEEQARFSVQSHHGLDDPSRVSKPVSAYQSSLDFVDSRVAVPFQPYLRDQASLFETATFFFEGHPQLELDDNERPRGRFKYMSDLFPRRVEVVQGRWPYSTAGGSPPAQGEPLEVAIDTLGTELLQLGIGHEMTVFPAAGATAGIPMNVRIVGVFQRAAPDDEFWRATGKEFSSDDDQWTTVPLFTTEDAIFQQVGRAYPGLHNDVTWFFFWDRRGIRVGDVGALQDEIPRVERDVRRNLNQSSITIDLADVLDDYEEQLLLARIPLFLMLFLVTGILVYYLALIAGLVVRSRATEISMLKSRGSTTGQIGLLALFEGLLLAIPAVALGPLLGLGVSRALGRLFFDSAGVDSAPVALSSEAFLLGLGGAFLAVAVITIATLMAARHGIVEFRQTGARPPTVSFIHRYYLDILVLALIGVFWWQVQSRDSFLVRSVGTGELHIDFSLLLGPVLVLLGLGLLVLRVFRWAVALAARAAEPIGPAWLAQGLRRVSREPLIPGTLVVMLMLATALGVIGSAFSSTLERSQRDRGLYLAGADMRAHYEGERVAVSLLGLSALAGEVDGVGAAAEVRRMDGDLLVSGLGSPRVDILAVDTEHFADVAWYRPDFFGGRSLGELVSAIVPDPSSPTSLRDGIRLPEDARALALWVRPGQPEPGSTLIARLQDARGYYFDVLIGDLGFSEWRRLEANLTALPPLRRGLLETSRPPSVTPPFAFLSLQVHTRLGAVDPGALFLDSLIAVTPREERVLADFQTLDRWHVVEDHFRPGLSVLEPSESVARSGRSAAFSWAMGGRGDLRSVRAGPPEIPIPAVVSKSLLDITEAQVGDILNIATSNVSLRVRMVAGADFFATLDPRKRPFMLLDLKTFTHYMNLHELRRLHWGSNELWVSLDDPARAPTAIVESVDGRGFRASRTQLASDIVAERVDQPLVNASWSGLLVLMFLALVLASASGLMLFSYVDAQERQTEFALLRTLGFSRSQLNGVVWFNLLLMVACGIGLGTWAGHQIAGSLLPILEVAEGGARVTPPMVLQTNWSALLVSYMVLAVVTASMVVWLAVMLTKLDVQRVLRIGEA